jgi:type VI secretion system protein ImpG
MNRRYYEEELRYLREAGRAFAEAHPEEAAALNIDSIADRDPYVERLFEGFAFLTGRVHARLDDDLPEYTEGLLQLLYPHFLNPIPSLAVVALAPKPGLVQATTTLARGTEVRSDPVGPESAPCRFQTTAPVHLHPVRLADAAMAWNGDAASQLTLQFDLARGVTYDDLDFGARPLRIYLHADAPLASTLHLFCTRHVRGVRLSAVGTERSVDLRGARWVQPVGFDREEGLLPYGPRSFVGFRLLQEYLSFRRKFWFVDLHGLDRLDAGEAEAFTVTLYFDRAYPEDKRFTADHLRLHCAPVVNLFRMDAEPIRVEGLVPTYRIVPSARFRRSIETYDVLRVEGINDETGARRDYAPYFSFRHHRAAESAAPAERPREPGGHFTTTRRMGPGGRAAVHLALGGTELPALSDARSVTLTVETRCTNGDLPHAALQEGMLDRLGPDVPQIVRPENLTRPTPIRPYAGHQDKLWDVVAHLSVGLQSVASREALCSVLRLYDRTRTDANRRRLAGIRSVRWEPKEIVARGAVLRGTEVTVDVQAGHFADEGDLCLFGAVLSTFFALYASINSFVHLTITVHPSGRVYHWRPDRGARALL